MAVLDHMGSLVQSNSLLALIGAGCHRLSEIGSRVGQAATNLSRPLSRLIDLGYVRRNFRSGHMATGRSSQCSRSVDYARSPPNAASRHCWIYASGRPRADNCATTLRCHRSALCRGGTGSLQRPALGSGGPATVSVLPYGPPATSWSPLMPPVCLFPRR